MGRGSVRAGSPVTGTQAAAGTDNSETDPRIVLFSTPVRPCIVTNNIGNGYDIRVKVNAETAGTVGQPFDGSGADSSKGFIPVADGEAVDVSLGGSLAVHSVSFITTDAGDDLDDVSVVGWES